MKEKFRRCNNISYGDNKFDMAQEILFAKLATGSQRKAADRLQSIGLKELQRGRIRSDLRNNSIINLEEGARYSLCS